MVKPNDIISQCYVNLTNAVEKYQDNWIFDETWFRVISAHYPNVINSVGFSRVAFNRAISRRVSQCGTPNDSGICMHHFQMPCLYEGIKRKVFFYYRQVAGEPHDCKYVHIRVGPIGLSTAEQEESPPLHDLQQLQSKSTARCDSHNVGDNGNVCDDDKGHRDDSECNLISSDGYAMHDDGQKAQNKPVYWDLPEAVKLFGFNYDEGCNVYNGLVDRCELLWGVLRRPKGYKSIIQHSDEPLSENQVFHIRNKCVFLLRAYKIALKKMGTSCHPETSET